MTDFQSVDILSVLFGTVYLVFAYGSFKAAAISFRRMEWDRVPGRLGLYYPRRLWVSSLFLSVIIMLLFTAYGLYYILTNAEFQLPFNFFDMTNLQVVTLAQLFFVTDLIFTQVERLKKYRWLPITITVVVVASAIIRAFLFL